MIDGWTKENAIDYCIDILNNTLNYNNIHNIEKILKIYQKCFSSNERERFYRSLWRNVVCTYIENSLHEYEVDKPTLDRCLKDLKKYNNASSSSEFITNLNELFKQTFGELNDAPILQILHPLKEYLKGKYKRLLEQDITGPECLMNYIYYHADSLILPDDREENKWILPNTILIGLVGEKIVSMNSHSTQSNGIFKVSETCCFCSTGMVTKAFAYKETLYGWKVYRTCKDCEDFKNYCNYYLRLGYVNSSEVRVYDIKIQENNHIDFEHFVQTLKK
jgi:hypothetical protein